MITKMTALIIASNPEEDISCSFGGPAENGKYVGWISLWRKDDHKGPRPLLSTEPQYSSGADAILAMEKVVKEIREHENKLTD